MEMMVVLVKYYILLIQLEVVFLSDLDLMHFLISLKYNIKFKKFVKIQ